jgi:succinate dehydrogenase/fumarate reductase cytochrome b subunit
LNPVSFLQELYSESAEVYRSRLHRVLALTLVPFGFLLAANNFGIASQADPACLTSCVADYTLLGVWLIIVPVSMMALANYYLVMRPAIQRKRTLGLRTGLSGERMIEPD